VTYFPYLHQWRYRSCDFFQFAFERKISQFFAWDYIINRTLHAVVWRYDFYLLVLKTIFYSLAALFRKILFSPLEEKSHIFAPPCNILYLFFCKSAAGGILAFSAIWLAAAAGGILRYLTTVRNPIRINGRSKAKIFCMFVLKLKNMNM
jgi:hypothetical protein